MDVSRDRTPVRRLEFVEVRSGPAASRGRTARAAPTTGSAAPEAEAADLGERPLATGPVEPAWSLWGDGET
ncbi:MAG: hypothetical protein A2Z32_07700 [Chloroflexi bacterium RBG_16_69_14]|nr:MAG: hypothetical protein A2Z32_07700 [Chloroflexi bacterium RBG_16_69_14]